MATIGKRKTRKTTTRRKTGASKKRKARVGESNTLTIAGVGRFTKKSCSTTKTGAEKLAEAIRNPSKGKGRLARVIKTGKAYCVFEGRTRKANAVPTRRRRA